MTRYLLLVRYGRGGGGSGGGGDKWRIWQIKWLGDGDIGDAWKGMHGIGGACIYV